MSREIILINISGEDKPGVMSSITQYFRQITMQLYSTSDKPTFTTRFR